jgi:hypothetical protein
MKSKLMILTLAVAASGFAATRFFVGFGFGGWGVPAPVVAYAPPPVAYVAPAPVYPAPTAYANFGYTWIGGYYYPMGARWAWRAGYWAPRPWAGAVWAGPRWSAGRWYGGYWRR